MADISAFDNFSIIFLQNQVSRQKGVKKAENCIKKAQNNIRKALKDIKKAPIASKVIKYHFCTNIFKYKPSQARIRIFIPQYSLQWQSHHIFLFDMFSQQILYLAPSVHFSQTLKLSVLALLH